MFLLCLEYYQFSLISVEGISTHSDKYGASKYSNIKPNRRYVDHNTELRLDEYNNLIGRKSHYRSNLYHPNQRQPQHGLRKNRFEKKRLNSRSKLRKGGRNTISYEDITPLGDKRLRKQTRVGKKNLFWNL